MSQWTEEDPGRCDSGALYSLAASLRKASGQVGEEVRVATRYTVGMEDWWQGKAADAFASKIGQAPKAVETAAKPVAEMAEALEQYASHCSSIDRRAGEIKAAVAKASKNPLYLANPIALTLFVKEAKDARGDLVAERKALDSQLAQAISSARGAITQASSSSLFNRGFGARTGGGPGGHVGKGDIPTKKSPEEVNQWWKSLTPDQQRQVAKDFPDLIGNLDGVPPSVRGKVNEERLGDEIDRLRDEIEERRKHRPFGSWISPVDAYDKKTGDLHKRLDALLTIEQSLKDPRHSLLLLDAKSGRQVRAAVASGDIENADNVAVLTGGITTSADGEYDKKTGRWTGGMVDKAADADRVVRDANLQGDGITAAVYWMGYDAPTGFTDTATYNDTRAREGAKSLESFSQGINATHARDPHLTLIGHSYGSTVTGLAAQGETGADDVIVMGSPGMGSGAKHITGDIYAMRADHDPIAPFSGINHGSDPMDDPSTIKLDTNRSNILNTGKDHSLYYDEGSISLRNIAAVVSNSPDWLIKK